MNRQKMASTKKTGTSAKTFFIVCVAGLMTYLLIAFYNFRKSYITAIEAKFQSTEEPSVKYILVWTPENITEKLIPEGQDVFLSSNCITHNCFVTSNRSFLEYETDFDAIIFNSSLLRIWNKINHPQYRTANQKYIFYGKVPPKEPICDDALNDNYFNITWTYRLSSDIVSPFIEVVNDKGIIEAPKNNAKWHSADYIAFLDFMKTKSKPLVTVVNDCQSIKNKSFFRKLRLALKTYSMTFDIYGCKNTCPGRSCDDVIRNDYYFYLIYDSLFAEDYVTKEVLMAYNNKAVPILIGGANYSKFLPEGSYINAKDYTVRRLSIVITHIIRNPDIYLSYFHWRNRYTIQEVETLRGICQLCSMLNNNGPHISKSSGRFKEWWFPKKFKDQCMFQNYRTF